MPVQIGGEPLWRTIAVGAVISNNDSSLMAAGSVEFFNKGGPELILFEFPHVQELVSYYFVFLHVHVLE